MLLCLRPYCNRQLALRCQTGDKLIGPTPELEVWLLREWPDAFILYEPAVSSRLVILLLGRRQALRRSMAA